MLRPILLVAPLLAVALVPASIASPTCVPFAASAPEPAAAEVAATVCAEPGTLGVPRAAWRANIPHRVELEGCAPCAEPSGSIHVVRQGTNPWPVATWSSFDPLFTCSSSTFIAANWDVGIEVTCFPNAPPPGGGQWYCFNALAYTFVSTGPGAKTTTGCQGGSVTAERTGNGAALVTAPYLGLGSVVTCRVQGEPGEGWHGACSY